MFYAALFPIRFKSELLFETVKTHLIVLEDTDRLEARSHYVNLKENATVLSKDRKRQDKVNGERVAGREGESIKMEKH